jgi:hypothetical protein
LSSTTPSSSSSTTASSSTTTSSTSSSPTSVPEPGSAKPSLPATGAYFGTWRGPGPGRPADPQASIVAAERAIGRTYAIDHRYYDWGTAIPSPYDRWTAARGRIPMVSLCACRFGDSRVVPWASIASGREDAYIDSVARGFVALAKPAFFVFDSEPERQVAIRGGAADYRAAWRHVVARFRALGADNVAFVWATTAYAFRPEVGQLALVESLYPGDDVVDWIASDPYNFNAGGAWQTLGQELAPWYRWAAAEHASKPLALTEWGSKEDASRPNRKAMWFHDALTGLQSKYRRIRAVVYFDEEKHERGTVNDWRIDTSSSSLAAFAEIAHGAWFRHRS